MNEINIAQHQYKSRTYAQSKQLQLQSTTSLLEKIFSYSTNRFDLVVFSHLRWEFVTQRPQHILARMAKKHRVLFFEEPIPFKKGEFGTAKIIKINNQITLIQPRVTNISDTVTLRKILNRHLNKLDHPYIAWFYSPQFLNLLPSINPLLTIYDCMDQLAAFKDAPDTLIENEHKLLKIADLVFTGGRSLYQDKSQISDKAFCYPSSVDLKHFAKARHSGQTTPSDLNKIPFPRVGFYGVIDERIDLKLLAFAAKKLPLVSFIMIGPVVKISPQSLPSASNIYYLGPKEYSLLPNYLHSMSVAMMPFALNKHTKFISPTKTLEYLAAGTPVVSTSIKDVVTDYSEIVNIANSRPEFVNEIKSLLIQSKQEKQAWLKKVDRVLSQTSWDKTVKSMEHDIKAEIRHKLLTGIEDNRYLSPNLLNALGIMYESV
jgi:glycosyltransferase involved in cell wall biosynthesis